MQKQPLQAGPLYAEAFLTVLRNVTKEDTVQYVLALLDDMLSGKSPNLLRTPDFSLHNPASHARPALHSQAFITCVVPGNTSNNC